MTLVSLSMLKTATLRSGAATFGMTTLVFQLNVTTIIV